MSKKVWVVVGVLILVGALVRFANLNSLPIFADESIYVRWSQVMRAEAGLRFLPLSDGKQPLFMWATIPFLKVVSNPLISGRLLSVLCGLGLMAGIFALTQVLFSNTRQSLIAAALATVMPYLVFFSRMALADTMLAMFMVWTAFFSLVSLKYDRWDFAMVAGFTFGFAWLTKSPGMFMFGLLPLGLLLVKPNLKSLWYLLTTFVIGLGMYNILRLGPEFSMIAIRNKDYIFPFTEVLQHPLDPLIPHLKDSAGFYWYFVTPIGMLLAVLGVVLGKFKQWGQKIILLAWFLGPIVAQSAIAKQYTARYVLFTVPFAIILMSYSIVYLSSKYKKLAIAALLLVMGPALFIDFQYAHKVEAAPLPKNERSGYLEEWTAGQGLEDVAQRIQEYAKQGPVIVGSEGFFGTPFDALQLYLNKNSNVRVVGVGVWIEDVNERLKNALADNQVFLVVNSDRFHGDADKLGLKLISSYPKARRADGTNQSLLFFQVMPQ